MVPGLHNMYLLTRHAGRPYSTSKALLKYGNAKWQLNDLQVLFFVQVLAPKSREGFRDRPVRTCASAAGAEGDCRG